MDDGMAYLIMKGMEEAGEVSQALSKGGLFGLFDSDPKTKTPNIERIINEVNDFLGVLDMIRRRALVTASAEERRVIEWEFARLNHPDAKLEKQEKVLRWASHSAKQGKLSEEGLRELQNDHRALTLGSQR